MIGTIKEYPDAERSRFMNVTVPLDKICEAVTKLYSTGARRCPRRKVTGGRFCTLHTKKIREAAERNGFYQI